LWRCDSEKTLERRQIWQKKCKKNLGTHNRQISKSPALHHNHPGFASKASTQKALHQNHRLCITITTLRLKLHGVASKSLSFASKSPWVRLNFASVPTLRLSFASVPRLRLRAGRQGEDRSRHCAGGGGAAMRCWLRYCGNAAADGVGACVVRIVRDMTPVVLHDAPKAGHVQAVPCLRLLPPTYVIGGQPSRPLGPHQRRAGEPAGHWDRASRARPSEGGLHMLHDGVLG
jgi:hypothetical protein